MTRRETWLTRKKKRRFERNMDVGFTSIRIRQRVMHSAKTFS